MGSDIKEFFLNCVKHEKVLQNDGKKKGILDFKMMVTMK